MSPGGTLLLLATLAAGVLAAGAVRCALTAVERLALAAVLGVVLTAAVEFALGAVLGVHLLTGILAAGVVATAALLPARRRGEPGPLAVWRADLATLRAGWTARDRAALGEVAVLLGATLGAVLLLRHALVDNGGALQSSYATVWADWSLHSTLASSFAQAQNLPPHDPILAGGSLRYPFLADLAAGFQESAGDSVGAALAVGSGVLAVAALVLVAALGRRLAGSVAAGALAALICVGGGSLGWTGTWWDACHASGRADSACAAATVLAHPATLLDVAGHLPGAVTDPVRPYDNLEADATQSVGNVQWYTPLLAWWLPQRTFVAGFAVGTAVLLLLVAARRAPPGTRSPHAAAGLLLGLLPLVHLHTLIALTLALLILGALGWRRREWWWTAGLAAALAAPRLLLVARGGNGVGGVCSDGTTGAGGTGTAFPYLEPGWLARAPQGFAADLCAVPGRFAATPAGILRAVPATLATAVDGRWWGFWLMNWGGLFVVLVAAAIAAAAAAARPRATWRRHLDAAIPVDLRRLALALAAVFLLANVVVTQTWDWDNTKLLAWAQLGGALLTGALLARLARSGPARALLASLVVLTLVGSGALQLVRIARDPNAPYTWASAADRALAADVAEHTAHDAVFLTPGDPTDPVLTLAGRTTLAGYAGWLYSYGVDVSDRSAAIATMLAGCDTTPSCPVPDLLRSWHVDYVEMCADAADPRCAGAGWYARTYPVVAGAGTHTVYDVRRP